MVKLIIILFGLMLAPMSAAMAGETEKAVRCDESKGVMASPLALPEDFALNTRQMGGFFAVIPGGCGEMIYSLTFPEKLAAAEKGDVKAQDQVGLMYAAGAGTAQDWALAKQWLDKAAAAGSGNAHYRLSIMFQHGHGVAKDDAVSLQHMIKASDAGLVWAMTNLGIAKINGTTGAKKNLAEAHALLEKARGLGDATATATLSILHWKGEGVAADSAKAFALAKEAAADGNEQGQRLVGAYFAQGIGVAPDMIKAYMWTSIAIARGDQPAVDFEAQLKARMAAKDMEAAKVLAKKCEARDFKACD